MPRTTIRKGNERNYNREYMREYRKNIYNKHMEQKRDRERKRRLGKVPNKQLLQKVLMIKERAERIDQLLKTA